jgi:hypothetical protein
LFNRAVGLVEDAVDFVAAGKLGPDALDGRFDFEAFRAAVLGLVRRAIVSHIGLNPQTQEQMVAGAHSGVPTPMNPPIINDDPSGTISTAFSRESIVMSLSPHSRT